MAAGSEGTLPSDHELKHFCNMGYSTGCARLPQDRRADANRFFVTRNGEDLKVVFCSERNHLPVEHAVLTVNSSTQTWTAGNANACVQRQAECVVNSYLRKMDRRAAEEQSATNAVSLPVADDRRPTTDDLASADRRPKIDDLASSHPPILPVEVSVP